MLSKYQKLDVKNNETKINQFSGLLVGRGKKSEISRNFREQIRGKNSRFRGNFRGIFEAGFAGKRLVKNVNGQFSWKLAEQISLESDWFCADLRKVFNETRHSYNIYSSFIPQYEIVSLQAY